MSSILVCLRFVLFYYPFVEWMGAGGRLSMEVKCVYVGLRFTK